MPTEGRLYLVSVGPGFADLVPDRARLALEQSEVIVGYDLYLRWILPWIQNKQIETYPLTQERRRAERALTLARQGKSVSLVSSGDIGVYAMATLALEQLRDEDDFHLEVIPGISAANACAALLGAPLSHDYATLSLSDLLCPWDWIENRARHLADADLVVALYNVQSKQRPHGVYRILDIFGEHKSAETWCGIVRNAYREEQSAEQIQLQDLKDRQFDMLTTLVIGNRFTRQKRGFLFTPRGYEGWDAREQSNQWSNLPRRAVWVFSGTRDGNQLVQQLRQLNIPTVVSVAHEFGARSWQEQEVPVVFGRLGFDQRKKLLQQMEAIAIVDGTHPYAEKMTCQLHQLSAQLNLTYLRWERPSALAGDEIVASSIVEAATLAMEHGTKILLTTGSQLVPQFLEQDPQRMHKWFVRCAPSAISIKKLEQNGFELSNICAQQGPFSLEENLTLLKRWHIEVLVSKDSGIEGGYPEKHQAAQQLGIPLIVLQRPHPTTKVFQTFPELWQQLQPLIWQTHG